MSKTSRQDSGVSYATVRNFAFQNTTYVAMFAGFDERLLDFQTRELENLNYIAIPRGLNFAD